MLICGIEKLSLIDYPGKLACTIFLFGCNFKCPFCHNPELVLTEKKPKELSEEAILDFLKKRKKYLDAVCISGGEPLINPDIKNFIKKIKSIGYLVKIDTNGSNPDLLKQLIEEGLIDFVAMDIKSDKENYSRASGISVNLEDIIKSIKIILSNSDKIDYEFRTTVVPGLHNKENIENIVKFLRDISNNQVKTYTLQKFIPRKNKLINKEFEKLQPFSDEEMQEFKKAIEEILLQNTFARL